MTLRRRSKRKAQSIGGVLWMCKVDYVYFTKRMRKKMRFVRGEVSAKHYGRNFNSTDSGLVPWLSVVGLICIRK